MSIPAVGAVQEIRGRSFAFAIQRIFKATASARRIGFTRTAKTMLRDNLLPLVNLVASLLKRWLLGTHQGAVQHSHLDYYLDEYTFRFNRRTSKSRGLLFYRLLTQAIDLGPVLEADLKAREDAQNAQA